MLVTNLMIEHDSLILAAAFHLIVLSSLEHVICAAKEGQVHHLIVKVVLLTQADGAPIGLRSCVEVYRLLHLVLVLIRSRQLVACGLVSCLIANLSRLP